MSTKLKGLEKRLGELEQRIQALERPTLAGLGRLLTLNDVAGILSIHLETVRRLVREGELPALKVGGHYRVSETALLEWLQR